MIATWAVGWPGQSVRWYQGVSAPDSAEAPAGCVVLLYEPEDGLPLPAARISADGSALVLIEAGGIEAARAVRWAEALVYRNRRQEGGCETALGRVDTDADSQRKINGAVTAAMVAQLTGAPFPPIGWTMADNAIVAHDAAAMIAMGMAVIANLDACQQAGAAIRALIAAAAAAEDLAAIDITAGYPA